MSGQMPSVPDPSVPAVLFCCAEDDEIPLVGIVAELRNRGFNPEILTGVDLDTTVLGKAVDATPGRGLFVLCESNDLDAFQIRRLEGVFSARSGPMHEVCSVKVSDGPRVVGQVERRVGQMGAPRAAPSDGRSTLRDVVGPAAERTEAIAREFLRAMVETEAKLAGLERDADEPGSHSTLDIQDAPTVQELGGAAAVAASDSAAHLVHREDSLEIPIDTEEDEDTSADGSPETTAPMSKVAAAPAEPRSGTALPLLLVLAVVAGGGYFGWQYMQQQPGPETAAAVAPPLARPQPEPPAEESPAAAPDPAQADDPAAAVPSDEDDGAQPQGAGTGGTGPAPDPEALAAAGEEDPAAEDPGAEGEDEDEAEGDPVVAAGDSADAAKIEAALERGEIRALDGMLMHVPNEPEMPWIEAANACKKKKYAGVFGWKVPSLKSLRKLRKARMLPRGSWWSTTLSDVEAKDEVYVVNTAERMPVKWLKMEPNARPLCVRPRP